MTILLFDRDGHLCCTPTRATDQVSVFHCRGNTVLLATVGGGLVSIGIPAGGSIELLCEEVREW